MKEKIEGPLAEPFEPLRFGIFMTEGEKNERSAKRRGEEIRKLILLCEHYGIPSEPPMFLELALVLARKICPGFQELKPRGRKRKWTKCLLAIRCG